MKNSITQNEQIESRSPKNLRKDNTWKDETKIYCYLNKYQIKHIYDNNILYYVYNKVK